MKTKNYLLKCLFGAAIIGLATTGCRKQEVNVDDTNDGADHATSEKISNEADNISDGAARGNTGSFKMKPIAGDEILSSSCAVVTKDSANSTYTVTVDFGTGCTGNDGKTRKGKIIITYSGDYWAVSGTKTITFSNYYVNDNHVEGTRTITNKGTNGSGNYYWSIHADMKITFTDGKVHSWLSDRTREMIAGYSTQTDLSDDVYSITGGYTGTRKNGDTYTADITTALIRKVSCRQFVSGVIDMVDTSADPKRKVVKRSIDYGNGDCDDSAVVTVTFKNGKTKTKTITV